MLELLARHWWVILLRGLFAIIFGVFTLANLGIALATLVIFFGAYVFVNGIFTLIHALRGWKHEEDRWLPLIDGLLGVWVGIITFRNPAMTAVMLVLFIAIWSLVSGVLLIIAAVRLRKIIQGEAWLAFGGIVSIFFALLLMWAPGAGALSLLWLIASYAILFGIILIVFAFKLRGLRARLT